MAAPPYREKLIPFCESRGLAEIRRLRHMDNHFHSLDWAGVDAWLAVKEAEDRDASKSLASRANRIALVALVIAAIAAHKEIRWLVSSIVEWIGAL